PTSSILYPANGGSYVTVGYSNGNLSDAGLGSGVSDVSQSYQDLNSGLWWNGSSFAGASEQFFATLLNPLIFNYQMTGGSYVNGVFFADGDNGWAVCSSGYTYHTTNGGKTWTYLGQTLNGNSAYGVYALDQNNVWVVGGNGFVAHATDGTTFSNQVTTGGP